MGKFCFIDNLLGYYWLYSITIFYMLSQSAWKKQQSVLSQQASNLSILKKQITKQSEIDASIQSGISHKINTLKQNAAALAKRLQNEKHKNAELEHIIKQLRLAEGQNGKEAGVGDIPALENRVKKLEYDLGQLNGKANRISESVEEKRQLIAQSRTERVIDSGIFRNIEIELIDADLKFKKLLLEKVVHQEEYQKELKHYQELKLQANNFKPKQERTKITLSHPTVVVSQPAQPAAAVERKTFPLKKFTNVSHRKSIKVQSMAQIDDETHFQSQQKVLVIKKLLVETGLPNQQQLLDHFFRIDEIADRAYNQMNACITQCNQIEAYHETAKQQLNIKNKLHLYQEGQHDDQQQALKKKLQKIEAAVHMVEKEINAETDQITIFFKEQNFQRFMSMLGPSEDFIPDLTESHLEQFKNLLQALEKKAQGVVAKQKPSNTQNTAPTQRSKSGQKLQELITKARRNDENLKVLKREDFQEEYHKIVKNTSKNNLLRKQAKRKSNASIRR